MKKLRLKALSLGAKEILSRQQLKEINGGGACLSALDCEFGQYCDTHTNPITNETTGVCVTADTGGSGSGEPHGSSPDCGLIWDSSIQQYVQACPIYDASHVFMGCGFCY